MAGNNQTWHAESTNMCTNLWESTSIFAFIAKLFTFHIKVAKVVKLAHEWVASH